MQKSTAYPITVCVEARSNPTKLTPYLCPPKFRRQLPSSFLQQKSAGLLLPVALEDYKPFFLFFL